MEDYINNLENEKKIMEEKKSSPRHNSLFHRFSSNDDLAQEIRNEKNSKSIDKLILPRFNQEKEQKNVILHKISRKMNNKVRKLYFEFWVGFENTDRMRKQR